MRDLRSRRWLSTALATSPGATLLRFLRRPRWGNLRRHEPFSDRYGYDRGTPVDRRLIEDFIQRHRDALVGRALEVKSDTYTRRFGHSLHTVDVVDIDESNPAATIIGDLCDPETLPSGAFDCALITQTLMYVAEPGDAIRNLVTALAPGGHLLITVATASRVDLNPDTLDRWRLTPEGIGAIVRDRCPDADVRVEHLGNLTLSIAFLHGLAVEELEDAAFETHDPRYPIVAAAVVRRRD